MSKRTMSGSEMLAHSKNRHEQNHLKEKLQQLTHSQFLVRDNSRVETQRWREFLKENHRNTGWSPMAMRPEVPGDGEGGSDTQDSPGATGRRRYDLQAIKKYQRPWAYTLKTGESHNKIYKELAQAGHKALYTPRQATLALIGAASFAGGRLARHHPRLAHTVPAVVGLERARSAWVQGATSNARHYDSNGKLLRSRQDLQTARLDSSSAWGQQQQQYETTAALNLPARSKLDQQVSRATGVTRARSFWYGKSKALFTHNANNPASQDGANPDPHKNLKGSPALAQSVVTLRSLRKSVSSWVCSLCGGDTHNLGQQQDTGSLYDLHETSVALKGLHRAKTVLDGLLYKHSKEAEEKTQEPSSKQLAQGRRHCTCRSAQPPQKYGSQTSDKGHREKRQGLKNKQKRKKVPVPAANRSQRTGPDKSAPNPRPKSVIMTRRTGVVGRPKGLFDTLDEPSKENVPPKVQSEENKGKCDMISSEHNTSERASPLNEKHNADKTVFKLQHSEPIQTVQDKLSQSLSQSLRTKENDKSQGKENVIRENEAINELHQAALANDRIRPDGYRGSQDVDGILSSLTREDPEEPSPVSQPEEDVFVDIDPQNDPSRSPVNPIGTDKSACVAGDRPRGQARGCGVIDKATHEENLELQDTFDTNALRKGKTRSLSTVKRRKFSFVSTAVSAFVKSPSTEDLGKRSRASRVRSYSVSSQTSVDSAATSLDGGGGGKAGSGRNSSKWKLENIICASNLARYSGRATRNENGEISYFRPWRQKKKKVSKMEVNVFYAIARYMLQKQKELKVEKLAQKAQRVQQEDQRCVAQNSTVTNDSTQDKSPKISDTLLNKVRTISKTSLPGEGSQPPEKSPISGKSIHTANIHNTSTNPSASACAQSETDKTVTVGLKGHLDRHRKIDEQPSQVSDRKAVDRASFSSSINGKSKSRKNTRSASGSAEASTLDPADIPNLASIIDPSKSPINLTNGVLDYDDDLSTLTSGVMLIPGRKQVKYKGILLRNYVSPQDRYKTEPRMRHKKPTSIRWHAKEGAMVMTHHSAGSEPASEVAHVVFPKQARQKALAKMVEDNHNQPVDNSARAADAALRLKIDRFLTSVEPFCQARAKTDLFS